jgi:hypothetical protein
MSRNAANYGDLIKLVLVTDLLAPLHFRLPLDFGNCFAYPGLFVAQNFTFPVGRSLPRRPRAFRRSLGDKLQELASRAPKDLQALETLVDTMLARLNEEDRVRHH